VGLLNVMSVCLLITVIWDAARENEEDGFGWRRGEEGYTEVRRHSPKLRLPPLSSLALRPKIEASEESGSCIAQSMSFPGRR
jgi:hypothetical protein